MEQLASEHGFQVLLAGLGPALAAQFHRRGMHKAPLRRLQIFDTAVLALQHGEDRILEQKPSDLDNWGFPDAGEM